MKKIRLTLENFIERSKATHPGQDLDYSKVVIVNRKTPVCIIDHGIREDGTEYGEYWQTPDNHLSGKSHPLRGLDKRGMGRRTSIEEILKKMEEAHKGEGYDLSKVDYRGMNKEVTIIHPIYGEFQITPNSFIKGCGYHKPNNTKGNSGRKSNKEEFVEKARKVYGNQYSYDKAVYKGAREKLTITCSFHGDFKQSPNNHLLGKGCPECAKAKISQKKLLTREEWIDKANEVHKFKYNYEKVNYVNAHTDVEIICPKHGPFWQSADAHLRGCNCPKCMNHYSKTEEEIVREIGIPAELHNRTVLEGKEIDIYYPHLKVGIEYNGLRWHTEWGMGKDANYHLTKTEGCNEKGIRLIQIFEDEYMNHKELVIDKLRHILKVGGDKERIMARKCEVREISKGTAKEFLERNHIQGFAGATIYLGCFTKEKALVGVMTFLTEGRDRWNLNRFATDSRYVCQGVGGKMFKYFVDQWNPKEIKSFADKRWTLSQEGNLYTALGFKYEGDIRPDYKYYDGVTLKRYHKFNFRKEILSKKYDLDTSLTENQMTKMLGYEQDMGLRIVQIFLEKEIILRTFVH